MPRLRVFFLRSLAVVGSTVAAILVTEGMLRASGISSPPAAVTVDADTYTRIPGVFYPSAQRSVTRIDGLAHRVSVNSLGFRGAPVALTKPAEQRRILFLGDSFTWGDLVDDSVTLPAQLEIAMSPHCPGTRVLNFGVGGTTIDGQREMFERALVLAPDLVILMFYENDLEDLRDPTFWSRMASVRERKARLPYSFVSAIARRSATVALAQRVLARHQAPPIPDSSGVTAATTGESADLGVLKAAYAGQLRLLRDRTDALSLPLLLIGYPSHHTFRERRGTALEWFEDTLVTEYPHRLSPLSVLRASGREITELYLLPRDGHATADAYGIVASALADALLAGDLRERACGAPTGE